MLDITLANTQSTIRQETRSKRRALSNREQIQHAEALAQQLSRFNPFRFSKKIALYLANDGEIDPALVITQAWNMGKQVYLPVLAPLKNQLYFAPYHSDSKMKNNRFGIAEPDCHPNDRIGAQQLGVLFLPLVAFDNKGNRVGMGGGFYDRSLAYLSMRQVHKKPLLIGLAHDMQQSDAIESASWDIPLDKIITEKRIIKVR